MRLVLCSPDLLFAEALAALIDGHGHFHVAAVECEPRAVLGAAKLQLAKLVVVDADGLSPSEIDIVTGAKAVGEFSLVLVTGHDPARLQASGADRIVRREDGSAALMGALTDLGGEHRIDKTIIRDGRKPYGAREDGRLSRREFEVAQLVAKGLSNRRIANVTALREQSIKNLVSVIMRKLDCDNRVQVALKLVNASVDQTSGSN